MSNIWRRTEIENRNALNILVGGEPPEGNRQLGEHKRKLKDIYRIGMRQLDLNYPGPRQGQVVGSINTVMNLQLPQNSGNNLISPAESASKKKTVNE
jgi:hypothetical protein